MLTTTSVLGKRKATTQNYVLHLASSPEPSSDFQPSVKLTNKQYPCTFAGCGKSYTKPSRLAEHARSHTGERPFVCNTCQKSYLRESHLQAHARSHLPSSDRPLVCSMSNCEKRFWTQQHLRAHIDWHNGLKPFLCTEPDCDESFTKHNQLRSHLCTTHAPPGTKPFQCSHKSCTKSFDTNQHLRTHMRTHNEKRYTCIHDSCLPTAERAVVFYPTLHALQHHTRTTHPPTCAHTSCNGRVFASQKGLREHEKLHNQRDEEARLNAIIAGSDGEDDQENDEEPPKKRRRGGNYGRDWKCEVEGCTKDFKSSKALNIHHKVAHLGQREFVCPHEECGTAFGYKHLLQRHLAKYHSHITKDDNVEAEYETEAEAETTTSEIEAIPEQVGCMLSVAKVPAAISIGAITGSAYSSRANDPEAIHCPYPNLDFAVGAEQSPDVAEHGCAYVFRRAYDLRRHLRAVHSVEAEKEKVDAWVRKRKRKVT